MRNRVLSIGASISAALVLLVLVLWVRGYTTGSSVSLWGSNRIEFWSQTGQFGLYVSKNHSETRPLLTASSFEIRPLDTQAWKYNRPGKPVIAAVIQPDKRVFKGFEGRMINGRYPEIELPCWFFAILFSLLPFGWCLIRFRDTRTPREKELPIEIDMRSPNKAIEETSR